MLTKSIGFISKLNFRKRLDIIRSSLTLLKGNLTKLEYAHVKRLMTDGTERDLIFTQGLATGMELAALNKKDTLAIISVIRAAIQKSKDGEVILRKADIEKIESVLQSRFPLGSRKRVLSMLSKGDVVFLSGLVEMLKRVA